MTLRSKSHSFTVASRDAQRKRYVSKAHTIIDRRGLDSPGPGTYLAMVKHKDGRVTASLHCPNRGSLAPVHSQ